MRVRHKTMLGERKAEEKHDRRTRRSEGKEEQEGSVLNGAQQVVSEGQGGPARPTAPDLADPEPWSHAFRSHGKSALALHLVWRTCKSNRSTINRKYLDRDQSSVP